MKAVTVSLEVTKEKQVTNSVDGASSLMGKPAKHTIRSFLSFAVSGQIGEALTEWLTRSGGGYKKDRQAEQIVNRCFKFLKFCCEDEEELTFEVMDVSLCSPNLLFKFIANLQEECKLGHSGLLGYIDAISESTDLRKVNGSSEAVLRNLSGLSCTSRKHAGRWQR